MSLSKLAECIEELSALGLYDEANYLRLNVVQAKGPADEKPLEQSVKWPGAAQAWRQELNRRLQEVAEKLKLIGPDAFKDVHDAFVTGLKTVDPVAQLMSNKKYPLIKAFWKGMELDIWKEGNQFQVVFKDLFDNTWEPMQGAKFGDLEQAKKALAQNGPLFERVKKQFTEQLAKAIEAARKELEYLAASRSGGKK